MTKKNTVARGNLLPNPEIRKLIFASSFTVRLSSQWSSWTQLSDLTLWKSRKRISKIGGPGKGGKRLEKLFSSYQRFLRSTLILILCQRPRTRAKKGTKVEPDDSTDSCSNFRMQDLCYPPLILTTRPPCYTPSPTPRFVPGYRWARG